MRCVCIMLEEGVVRSTASTDDSKGDGSATNVDACAGKDHVLIDKAKPEVVPIK